MSARNSSCFAIVAASTALLSTTAHSAPITLGFEGLNNTSSDEALGPYPNPFSEGGFDFVFDDQYRTGVPEAGFFFIGSEHPCVSACSTNGTSVFYEFNTGGLFLTRHDGGLFSLLNLDAAQAFMNMQTPLELYVTGQIAGGGLVSALFIRGPGAADIFSSFSLPTSFANLVSVTFSGSTVTEDSTSNFALDNLVVMAQNVVTPPAPTPITVPEPAGATLFALGLVGIGAMRRRKLAV